MYDKEITLTITTDEAREYLDALNVVAQAASDCALDDEWRAIGRVERLEHKLSDLIRRDMQD